MRISMVNGMLCIIAENPKDGYELATMEQQAETQGKALTIKISKEGGAAVTVRLPDAIDQEEQAA